METSHVNLLPGMCAVRQLVSPWLAKLCVLKDGGASKASRACVAQWQSICLVNRRSPVQSRAEARYCHAESMVVELDGDCTARAYCLLLRFLVWTTFHCGGAGFITARRTAMDLLAS